MEVKKEDLLASVDKYLRKISEGEIVDGKIVKITEKEVIVDIGYKAEGVVPITEFKEEELKEGNEIKVFIERIEPETGIPVLSKERADQMIVWDKIEKAFAEGTPVEGRVIKIVKGGAIVDIDGVRAFMPGSHADIKPVTDLNKLIGEKFRFKVIKANRAQRNIIVSRRELLEEEAQKKAKEILEKIEPGQVWEGTVKTITDFGVFVDLGGLEGLIHISDLSWGRVTHPSEVVQVGDKVKVKVKEVDKESKRVTLSIKDLQEYPWKNVDKKYPVGSKVKGKVVSIVDYGVFVELEPGVEGLIHISELSWGEIKHPSQAVKVGDEVEVVVLNVDKENEKIALSLKRTLPDPWETVDKEFPVGSVVKGKVKNFTNFGAFITLKDGVDGLLHIKDMSWTKKIEHPSDILKRGEIIQCKVLEVDKENRRISLGLKQLKEDPLKEFQRKHPIGDLVKGRIKGIHNKGVIIEFPDVPEVEGFVPYSHLVEKARKIHTKYSIGDILNLKVIEINEKRRSVILSETGYYEEMERRAYEEYKEEQEDKS